MNKRRAAWISFVASIAIATIATTYVNYQAGSLAKNGSMDLELNNHYSSIWLYAIFITSLVSFVTFLFGIQVLWSDRHRSRAIRLIEFVVQMLPLGFFSILVHQILTA